MRTFFCFARNKNKERLKYTNLTTAILVIGILAACTLFSGCEDVISVQLDEGDPLLVVDAFLDNTRRVQTIRLSKSSPYLSTEGAAGLTGARVAVVDLEDGRERLFRETSAGVYQWNPRVTEVFAEVGKEYELRIHLGKDTYSARSSVYPVPVIDSIVYDYEEKDPFQDEGYQAYFIAFDLEGQTDYYFIRSYRNGILRSRNIDFQVCVDAAYGEGADGLQFIEPVADFTPGDDPYRLGDSASVEIASIDKRTYGFLSQVMDLSTNTGLFATPPANVRSNIESLLPAPDLAPVGWFSVSAVSSAGIKIRKP
ncbi:uncharacterized protein DUF4249 [Anseongella ginsenosidimutans]|uniref:Uncharacterized protein DUF4249 n=1 Tax=Anseongella ginsenosidimutans TaxID=496056 RepID=A0A4R3KRP8_9SPHI|nr:DUF4249 domain-containing protein [Anseongella ginsenosidimutans]QEC52962.1 DUF4249 domain-containing protein [Anseongella ginsenosidimutans]TCS87364.1 uncharacterized protein DUF4249 [Anseongella ginsenosidimutans]